MVRWVGESGGHVGYDGLKKSAVVGGMSGGFEWVVEELGWVGVWGPILGGKKKGVGLIMQNANWEGELGAQYKEIECGYAWCRPAFFTCVPTQWQDSLLLEKN